MTSGHGIAHSEVPPPDTTVIHGVQPWVALPGEHRDAARDFQHHVPEPVRIHGAELRVFLGSSAGSTSRVRTLTLLLGAEITLDRVRRSPWPWTPPPGPRTAPRRHHTPRQPPRR